MLMSVSIMFNVLGVIVIYLLMGMLVYSLLAFELSGYRRRHIMLSVLWPLAVWIYVILGIIDWMWEGE